MRKKCKECGLQITVNQFMLCYYCYKKKEKEKNN
jgi:hypothetical protein